MAKINVDSTYWTHIKTTRLKAYCGNKADIFPIRLWSFCAEHHPKDGQLTGYDKSEIEAILGWDGVPGNLVYALEKLNFLEKDGENFRIHNWGKHAGFIWLYKMAGQKGGKKSGKLRRGINRSNPSTQGSTPHPRVASTQGSTIELNGIELNKYVSEDTQKPVQDLKEETPIQKIVRGWKLLTNVPTNGKESQMWDKIHFPRHARSADSLLKLFGDWEQAVYAMEFVFRKLTADKLTCSIETTVKHSDLYREHVQKNPPR